MDCGTGSTEDSCGDCAPCGNGNGDCQPVPGTQPPQCIETGNCSKAKLFQVTKNISIASLIPMISLIDLICLFFYRHKYHLSKLLSVASIQWKYHKFYRLQSIFDWAKNCKIFLQWYSKRKNMCIWGQNTRRTTGTKKAEKSSWRWWWWPTTKTTKANPLLRYRYLAKDDIVLFTSKGRGI